jgi:Transposase, Mutator family
MHYAADAADRIKQAAEIICQALINAELTAVIGAAPHEHTETRTNQRNGSCAHPVHDCRGHGATDRQAAHRVVLPRVAGKVPPGRSVPLRGDDGGLPFGPRRRRMGRLGDEKFFALLQDWTTRYRHGTVVTEDFTALAADYSDESLQPLWDAWLYSTDVP